MIYRPVSTSTHSVRATDDCSTALSSSLALYDAQTPTSLNRRRVEDFSGPTVLSPSSMRTEPYGHIVHTMTRISTRAGGFCIRRAHFRLTSPKGRPIHRRTLIEFRFQLATVIPARGCSVCIAHSGATLCEGLFTQHLRLSSATSRQQLLSKWFTRVRARVRVVVERHLGRELLNIICSQWPISQARACSFN